MFRIVNNVISLTRGDTARFNIILKDTNGGFYTPITGDILTMTVKQSISDTTEVFQIDAVDSEFTILPEHTSNLSFGTYFYDIQLTLDNGDINTVIPISQFKVEEEVTV